MRFDEWLWFPELPTEIFIMSFIRQMWMELAAAQLQMSLQNIQLETFKSEKFNSLGLFFLVPKLAVHFHLMIE